MAEINMTDENAEAELLALLRGQDSKNFSLTVTCDDGRWTVSTSDNDHGTKAIGDGSSFAEAWFRQAPGWARGGEA